MGIGYVNRYVDVSKPFLDEETYIALCQSGRQSQAPPWSGTVMGSPILQMDKASSSSLSLWQELALSAVRQSLQDAAGGDYEALRWLITEGRDWLTALGISHCVADVWGAEL